MSETIIEPFRNSRGSVSRVRTAEQCLRKFEQKYILKRPEDSGFPGVFGSVCHDALERCYEWIVEEEYEGLFPKAKLVESWNEAYEESQISAMPEATFDAYQTGRTLMHKYPDLITDVDHNKILENEGEFWFDLPGWDTCQMMGYIDRIDKVDHETIRVIDYKSNFLMFTADEVANDLQASIYVHAIKLRYPWAKKIEFGFHMLRHDVILMTERSEEQIASAIQYIVMMLRTSENGENYPASLNAYCAYCSYQHDCEVFQKAAKRGEILLGDDATIEEIAKEREIWAKLAKDAYRKKEGLESRLKAHFTENGPVEAAGMVYKWIKTKKANSTRYARKPTIEGLVQLGVGKKKELEDKLLIVDPGRLTRLSKKHLDESEMKKADKVAMKAEIESFAEQGYTTRLDARAQKEHK